MNRLGISINCHEMLQIDTLLATKLTQDAGQHRVHVPEEIKSNTVVHGAMDNFDHEENTLSGVGGSHDIALLLFQNSNEEKDSKKDQPGYIQIPPKSVTQSAKARLLDHVLSCQVLIYAKKYMENEENIYNLRKFYRSFKFSSRKQLKTWSAAWSNLFPVVKNNLIPLFAATNRLLSSLVEVMTSFAFTPVVPYLATEFDTIFTCMKNFQDVVQQRNLEYGPL